MLELFSRIKIYTIINLGLAFALCTVSTLAQNQNAPPREDKQIWPEVQITMPLSQRIDLVISGQLRIGRDATAFVSERAGMGLNLKVHKHLTLAPSYLHIATQPTPHRKDFENRLNFAATVHFPLGRFAFSDRNLFERRLREASNSTRYRNRLVIEHPLKIDIHRLNVYLSEEVSYDWSLRSWTRNRLAVGITRRINKSLTLDLYYMRQMDGRSRPGDIHIIGSIFRIRLD